jgi:hypothetical protein
MDEFKKNMEEFNRLKQEFRQLLSELQESLAEFRQLTGRKLYELERPKKKMEQRQDGFE